MEERIFRDEGLRILRTHVELLEGIYLTMSPMPTSNTQYIEKIKERIDKFKQPSTVFEDDFQVNIDWQHSLDVELKDAVERKISKHFRTWLWLLYTVEVDEIQNIRKEVGYNWYEIRAIASGIAVLYVYASVDIRRIGEFSKQQLSKYALSQIKSPSVYRAAEILVKNTWRDFR
jgi:hypothetical protein